MRSLGRIEVRAVPGLHWFMYIERVIRGPWRKQTDQLGRCYTWAVKDWRQRGDFGGRMDWTLVLKMRHRSLILVSPVSLLEIRFSCLALNLWMPGQQSGFEQTLQVFLTSTKV